MRKYLIISIALILSNYFIKLDKINDLINPHLLFSFEEKIPIEQNVFLKEELNKIKSENEKLNELLKLKNYLNYDYSFAKVVYWENFNQDIIIVINKGLNDNLKIGSGVITFEDSKTLAVGKIIELQETRSKVLTLISPSMGISCKKSDDDYTDNFIVSGMGENCYIKYLPYKYDFKENDLILTTGNDEIFHPNYLVGKVNKVKKSGNKDEIIIKPIVNFSKLKWVIILK